MYIEKWKSWGKQAKKWTLSLLFPRGANCLGCGDPRRASPKDCLCPACREALDALFVPAGACNRCLSPVRAGRPCAFCRSSVMKGISAVYAPYRYAGVVRSLIHAFKFNACDEVLPLLGDAMTQALVCRDFDCIVPVPLHPRRLRQRGVNQSLLLARALTERTGIPTREALLARVRYQKPQSRTPLSERRFHVAGAFSCPQGAAGLRILLVDDVRTSGSTAHACVKALLDGGAESVSLCVAAVVYRKQGRR